MSFRILFLKLTKVHDFEKPERIDTGGMKAYRIKAKDELNNGCLLFFDLKTGLLSALHFQNPADVNEIIKTSFSNWKKIQGLLLPSHVDIDQSGKIFVFDFIKVVFNDTGFQYKNVKK
jgi:hypothetical protein